MQPIAKRCKALGISPAVMGYAKKETNRNPGGQMRKKKSEYGIQLNEKQKVKFIYGILEKQFRDYYEMAAAAHGKRHGAIPLCYHRCGRFQNRDGTGDSDRHPLTKKTPPAAAQIAAGGVYWRGKAGGGPALPEKRKKGDIQKTKLHLHTPRQYRRRRLR